MPNAKIKTMRALASELGVSVATVSDALRNNPRVSLKTRELVHSAAKKLGYNYNPLAGAVMSEIRHSAVEAYRGTVGVVDYEPVLERPPGAAIYHNLMLQGAKEAAERLGFRVDFFTLRDPDRSIVQLNRMLEARGVRALLILPVFGTPSFSGINWERLTAIYADNMIENPPIHRCCPDHFMSMTIALAKLTQLKYKRPGLVLQKQQDSRLQFRWEAAFSCYWHHLSMQEAASPLLYNDLNQKSFGVWFRATKPDVVLAHRREVLQWMIELGCKVPETHGFCCLNLATREVNASGLDLMPHIGGSRAMEALIGQLLRGEFGIPQYPSTITYPAKWRDGPTLRQQ